MDTFKKIEQLKQNHFTLGLFKYKEFQNIFLIKPILSTKHCKIINKSVRNRLFFKHDKIFLKHGPKTI